MRPDLLKGHYLRHLWNKKHPDGQQVDRVKLLPRALTKVTDLPPIPDKPFNKHKLSEYYDANKELICQQISDLGSEKTRKHWHISTSSFAALKRRWLLPMNERKAKPIPQVVNIHVPLPPDCKKDAVRDFIDFMLNDLPKPGTSWTQEKQTRWLQLFSAIILWQYPADAVTN
jgi:hypothetical protein